MFSHCFFSCSLFSAYHLILSLSYFILDVHLRNCCGQHSCMSTTISIATLRVASFSTKTVIRKWSAVKLNSKLTTHRWDSAPEWLLRQCVGLAYPRSHVRVPVAAASLVICSPHLHRAVRGAQGVLPCVGLGVTASQLAPQGAVNGL